MSTMTSTLGAFHGPKPNHPRVMLAPVRTIFGAVPPLDVRAARALIPIFGSIATGVAIATITFASPLPAYAQRVDQADHTQTLASALEPPVSDGWKAPLVLPDTARSTPAEVPVICEVDRTGDILAC